MFINRSLSFGGRPVLAMLPMVKRSNYFVKLTLKSLTYYGNIKSLSQGNTKVIPMNPREERGLIIAATCRLHRIDDGTWTVPSQTNRDVVAYRVDLETKSCTCLDFTKGGFVCKHYYAASIVHKRDVLPDRTAYYGVIGNLPCLQRFRYEVLRVWRTWLSRRRRRGTWPRTRFNELLRRVPLPWARAGTSPCVARP
jgi:hypothetical protein